MQVFFARNKIFLKKSFLTSTFLLISIGIFILPTHVYGDDQSIQIQSIQKISQYVGNFTGSLDNGDFFGHSIAKIGDLNNDGTSDLAIGSFGDDDGGTDRGAVYILFLNRDGTVKSHQKISDTEGGFEGILDDGDEFGHVVTTLDDFDGDGVKELGVGANLDDDGGKNKGAVYILFLNRDGTVKSHQKISETEGGLGPVLDVTSQFGHSISILDDLDGDGVKDLAVGAQQSADGGEKRGAVFILFLNRDGTVKSHQKISDTEGGFEGILDDDDRFGVYISSIGDIDGDNLQELAVSAHRDDDGGTDRGAFYILFLNRDGTVKSHQKISDTEGGFEGTLDDGDLFGHSVISIGDLNSDGITELAVGAHQDDDGGEETGAIWIIFLNNSHGESPVKTIQKISDISGNFEGSLDDEDFFGKAVANMGDLNLDGTNDLAVGAYRDDDGAEDAGAVWILFLNKDGTVKSHQKISETTGGLNEDLKLADYFAYSLAGLGDLNGDSIPDLAVGAFLDDDGGTNKGAFYILFLNRDGTVKSHQKISDTEGDFSGELEMGDQFAHSINNVGDLDGDGVLDLGVGAIGDDDGCNVPNSPNEINYCNKGALWLLYLNSNGTIKDEKKISDTAGFLSGLENLGGFIKEGDNFGHSVIPLGDLNQDGINDLAVGADRDDDGGFNSGAVYILFMEKDGNVKSVQKISNLYGNFYGYLSENDHFGVSMTFLGDINGDGINDIAVGAEQGESEDQEFHSVRGENQGAVFLIFLNRDGTVKSHIRIPESNYSGLQLEKGIRFGHDIISMDDLDGNNIPDIAIGAHREDEGGQNRGAVWILFLSDFIYDQSNEDNNPVSYLNPYNQNPLAPLKQWKLGFDAKEINCKKDFVIIQKSNSDKPACVKLESARKLITRGWMWVN